MKFLALKEKFISENSDYGNDVSNFMNYMQHVYGLDLPAQQDLLINGMRTELIIKSLRHYVDIGQIKKQEPAKKYFVAIGQLFEFVLSNSDYSNDNLAKELANPSTREDSYSRKTAAFISENVDLLPKESLSALSSEKIKDLIVWCDTRISKDFGKCPEKDETVYKRITACLCIKLMILTGITYREARKIGFANLNAEESTIIINDFTIRLPKKLSVQFREYCNLKTNPLLKKSPYLFSDYCGKQWKGSTSVSGIPNFMKTAINETTVTGLIKYGITQLIKNGTNDDVIMKLTGVNKEIIIDCLDDIAKNDRIWGELYINSKITNTDIYYEL